MWKKKDFVALALAAVGSFSMTLGIFLPRVVNATGGETTAKVLSPVLRVNGCEIQAQAEGEEIKATSARQSATAMPGQLRVAAGPAPKLVFIVKNTTDAETTVAFSASMENAQPRGRSMSQPQAQWSDAFYLVLNAGETREIEVDTRLTFTGGMNSLTLSSPAAAPTAISALYFSVTPNQAAAPVPQATAKPSAVDPNKPVKFVTKSPATVANTPAGKSPVQLAVQAALRAANDQPAPQAVARNDAALP